MVFIMYTSLRGTALDGCVDKATLRDCFCAQRAADIKTQRTFCLRVLFSATNGCVKAFGCGRV
jgi:hypothetical protein